MYIQKTLNFFSNSCKNIISKYLNGWHWPTDNPKCAMNQNLYKKTDRPQGVGLGQP